MNKKTLSVAIALALALSTSANVLAAPSNTSSVTQVREQRQELETKVEKMDNQIVQVMKQIDDNKKNIEKIAKDIKKAQEDLDSAEKNIKGQQDLFNKRIRAMYINGVDSYLGVILESDNLGDFISRVDTVKKIVGFDQKVIGDLRDKKEQLSKKKESLNSENNKFLALKTDNEKKLAKLNSDKKEQTNMLATLKDKEKSFVAAEEESRRLIASAETKVQQARQATPTLSRGGSAASASSNSIVAYASNFLGTPYQWGGNGPSTFDCSGFTSYVYAHFGIGLPRIAADQQTVGVSVSRDQLQPGDLVFFGSPAHHVGIYVGDGAYIHAPRTGDVVKIAPLNRSDYSGARRVR